MVALCFLTFRIDEKLNNEFLKIDYAGSVPPSLSSPLMPMS
jgi:hypothetical protein